jgi:pre-rRNA-processing protein TSR1
MGTLKLYGHLRGGGNLDANSLIYIPSIGTYQMSEIYVMKRQVDKNNNSNGVCKETGGVSGAWELAHESDPSRQESLEGEAQYDEMNAEQTWPTEQELKDGMIELR